MMLSDSDYYIPADTGGKGHLPADTLWFHCDFLAMYPQSILQIHAEFFQKYLINLITM